MSVPPPGATNPPASRSGCVGRGCLLGCLVPIVLVIVGFLLVRPMLEERWAAWRADNPWIAQVPGLAAGLKGMVGATEDGNEAVSDTTGVRGGAARPREGINDKAAMPADLPIWPRARTETFNAGQDHAASYQRVTAPRDSVLRYFRRAMPGQGWRLDKEHEGAGGVLLLYRKGERIARVEVVADSAGTDIWLRTRATGTPER
jgi:hypothetical protein